MNFLKKSSVSSDPAPSDAKPEITAPDWYTHAHSTITATISANLHCLQLWEQLNIRFLKLDRERQVVEAMQQHLEREREELDAYRIHLEEEKKALFDAANEFEQFKRKWYNDHGIDPDELERLKKEEEESKKRMQVHESVRPTSGLLGFALKSAVQLTGPTLSKLDQAYHLSDKLKLVDKTYHVSDKIQVLPFGGFVNQIIRTAETGLGTSSPLPVAESKGSLNDSFQPGSFTLMREAMPPAVLLSPNSSTDTLIDESEYINDSRQHHPNSLLPDSNLVDGSNAQQFPHFGIRNKIASKVKSQKDKIANYIDISKDLVEIGKENLGLQSINLSTATGLGMASVEIGKNVASKLMERIGTPVPSNHSDQSCQEDEADYDSDDESDGDQEQHPATSKSQPKRYRVLDDSDRKQNGQNTKDEDSDGSAYMNSAVSVSPSKSNDTGPRLSPIPTKTKIKRKSRHNRQRSVASDHFVSFSDDNAEDGGAEKPNAKKLNGETGSPSSSVSAPDNSSVSTDKSATSPSTADRKSSSTAVSESSSSAEDSELESELEPSSTSDSDRTISTKPDRPLSLSNLNSDSSSSSSSDSDNQDADSIERCHSRQSTSSSVTTEDGDENSADSEVESSSGLLSNIKMMASPHAAMDKVKNVSGWVVGKVWRK